MRSIKWRDIQVGDEFIDGSKVTEISPITYKPCVIIKAKDNIETIVSEEHLIRARVFDGEECINGFTHETGSKIKTLFILENVVSLKQQTADLQTIYKLLRQLKT